jgi:hypothetical protein
MLSDVDFRVLLDRLDRSRAGYLRVRKGVKKRVRQHMVTLGCATIQGLGMETAFERIISVIAEGGILIIRTHEQPPSSGRRLERDTICPWGIPGARLIYL